VPGATFYSFQFQVAAAQLGEAVGAEIVNLVPELGDWNRTAAALAQMNLVISVDSSLAHLAGGMGLPVWIPLQAAVEWRWGLESPTTPWYPSARLFRQQRVHEWGPVFAQMAAELRELVARRRVEAA
jgi:glycosyl transferase family 9 (putative heptosyltransferase)